MAEKSFTCSDTFLRVLGFLLQIVFKITWMGIKPILLKMSIYNCLAQFTTMYTQFSNTTFIPGVAIYFSVALVCVTILLI